MDPVAGENANAYVYPGDPVNWSDVSGYKKSGAPQLSKAAKLIYEKYLNKENLTRDEQKALNSILRGVNSVKTQEKYNLERASRATKDIVRGTTDLEEDMWFIIIPSSVQYNLDKTGPMA